MSTSTEININDERSVRLHKLNELIDAGINPYPARVMRTHTIAEALETPDDTAIVIVGRIMTKRAMGKLIFAHIEDGTGRMQVALRKGDIDSELFSLFQKKFDGGDTVEVHGTRFTTHKGEPSVLAQQVTMLAKALLPLPDKFHGFKDEEARYRKRYLDLLVNKDQREKLLIRARVMKSIRTILDEHGFVEVETPMLETVASGAMARTFDTHLNAFDLPVHLRICMGELWQKRLLVGGFEKTYEMGRAFRNEGVDYSHNPEFTMLEFYWAYADMYANMKLHEEMIPRIVKEAVGTLSIPHEGDTLDFTPPYPVITFRQAILDHTGIDINDYDAPEDLARVMNEHGYEGTASDGRRDLLDNLYKQSARPAIIQPTFVTEYPVELKPLAKKAEDPRYTEMFQLVVKGMELSNSYTELNDPVDQRERFEEQAQLAAMGDEEAMQYDRDYVDALEHGMPPATGTGIGIDRFVALITDSHTIREITAFPIMKPLDHQASNGAMTNQAMAEQSSAGVHVRHTADELPMTREEAWALVQEHNADAADLYHYLESEAVLKALARRLGRDEAYWGMLGLVHDVDWGKTKHDPTTHLSLMPEILGPAGFSEQFIEEVRSHAYGCDCAGLQDMKRTKEIEFALAAGETITGLVHAAARLRPEKIATLKVSSLKKKFKDKKFAAGVNRDVVREVEQLGISLDEFFELAIDAIKDIADQVDLVA